MDVRIDRQHLPWSARIEVTGKQAVMGNQTVVVSVVLKYSSYEGI